MIYLDVESVINIHDNVIKTSGGSPGMYKDTYERVESVLYTIYHHSGVEKYRDIFEKASAIWYYMTNSHCFIDGNKRTSLIVMASFMTMNGYDNNMDIDYFAKIAEETASYVLHGEAIVEYIKYLADILCKYFWIE